MIKILHTADIHLDAPFSSLEERESARRDDFLKTFDQLIHLAIKNEVRLFLIAGDLFDHPRPSNSVVDRVQTGLRRLLERGIQPVILPGTHDNVVVSDSVYNRQEFPGCVVLSQASVTEPTPLEIDGQKIFLYGFAYRSGISANALESMQRRSDEGIHIGLLHGSRRGSPEWDYRKKDLPFSPEDLLAWNLDYVALGHYHSFDVIAEGGRTLACYPGSPEGKRFGENGPRYCALVHLEPGRAKVEKLAVQRRVLSEQTLELDGCSDLGDAEAAIRKLSDANLLLRLTLQGIVETPLDIDALQSRSSDGFFFLELIDRSTLVESDYAHRLAHEETVRGVFVRRVEELMGQIAADDKPVLEEAFREVLARFQRFGGGAA